MSNETFQEKGRRLKAKNDDEDDEEVKLSLEFNVEIIKHKSDEIEFKLDFKNPSEVSKERIWDQIEIEFKNPKDKFRSNSSFKTFDIQCGDCKVSINQGAIQLQWGALQSGMTCTNKVMTWSNKLGAKQRGNTVVVE